MHSYAVVGLGYVGLGLAVALNHKFCVYGYDINSSRIASLKKHIDINKMVKASELKLSSINFTDCLEDIREATVYIITVPTPAYCYEIPDLDPLIQAVKSLATIIKKNDTVIFESTVYPGTTEEICIPELEKISGLKSGEDFYVGYSPERINPGDSHYNLKNTTKIVSAQNSIALKKVKETYSAICDTLYPVSSIRIAEAIKILENTQRDVNIAFMNEFTCIMHAMKLDTHEIIEGAKTKWSFNAVNPGFVGGHCISVDPLYLAFKAKRLGVYPDLILTARKINDSMSQFVIQSMMDILFNYHIDLNEVTIGVFGISYKANTNDTRNSMALKLIKELKSHGFKCLIHDPLNQNEKHINSSIQLSSMNEMREITVAILAVDHDEYKNLGLSNLLKLCKKPKIFMDIPNLFTQDARKIKSLIYWNL